MLDSVQALIARQAEALADPETETRIAQYEMAFRMPRAGRGHARDLGREFGRTVHSLGKRDHHPRCYSVWLVGAGIRPGTGDGAPAAAPVPPARLRVRAKATAWK
jgi:hypothetical protein